MELYGQFSPRVDEILYERYFKYYQTPGFFIECGAADGISESCCYFFEKNLRWSGINVEASPKIYQALTKNRPHSKNVNLALSDSDNQKVSFTTTVHPYHGELFGNGSIKHTPEHLADLKQQNVILNNIEVTTMTYDSLTSDVKSEFVDLFVLDIEGHELPVLNSLSKKMRLPTVFVIEHGHLGQEKLNQILSPLGYELDYTFANNSYYILNSQMKPDMVRAIFEHQQNLAKTESAIRTETLRTQELERKIESAANQISYLKNELTHHSEYIALAVKTNRSIGRTIYDRIFRR